jgi:hypothetical protein
MVVVTACYDATRAVGLRWARRLGLRQLSQMLGSQKGEQNCTRDGSESNHIE